ncbi:metalloregulator ArsR/SmtB family transcription factor [Mammaliicoccus sp. G-M28]|uniref:ArsR/SmtB family transcription factor n=1 Tax=Mammaliicoccus sp. G-M28 TaxID=2898688 RepID=UPI001EFAF049|nr:metalloregulator ArsR/SmtB family transcription factor [Mammaliicoccus sp. G-M28]
MDYKVLSTLLKTISDSNRLEIIDLLSCGELCACDLLEHFQFSQPTLSHHMKSLVNCNLIFTRKEGNKRMYRLNTELFNELNNQLQSIYHNSESCICNSMEPGVCKA